MKVKEMKTELEIPEGLTVSVENGVLAVKGEKGELKRNFLHPRIKVSIDSNKIMLKANKATKREKTMIGTFKAHINNMLKGCKEGHLYKLKVCSGHFPMNVAVNNNDFVVKNFLGEKIPRAIKIKEGATVNVNGDVIEVESADKELAGQCAADIEQLTRITNRDRRIFQDGIWIIEKCNKAL